MSSTPLTDKALARLHTIAQGNGVDPASITLFKTEEAVYTLHADLSLTPRFEIGIANPQEIKKLQVERLPSSDAMRELANQRDYPREWINSAMRELKDMPAQGWGIDGKALRMDDFTRLFAVAERCQQCRGNGAIECSRCRNTGREECRNCMQGNRATGIEPNSDNKPCRVCNGRKEIQCRTCNGSGRVQCPACRGKGEAITTYALKVYADLRFTWIDSGLELPTALRRSVDRAGIAKLANGHATIERGEPREPDRSTGTIRVPYTATLPFATATFAIDGQRHVAQVLGLKTAILELNDFLDAPLQAAEATGTLSSMRIYQEAQIIRARAGSLNDLLRLYPTGVSKPMADQIMRNAGQKLRAQTRGPRWAVTGAALVLGAVMMWLYFCTSLQGIVNPNGDSALIDLALPAILAFLFMIGQRFMVKRLLEKQLGQANLRPPYFASHSIVGLSGIIVLFAAFVWVQAPTWMRIDKLRVEAEYNAWHKQP